MKINNKILWILAMKVANISLRTNIYKCFVISLFSEHFCNVHDTVKNSKTYKHKFLLLQLKAATFLTSHNVKDVNLMYI
jgi:hypothetical protein